MRLDERGKQCPLPVVETRKALETAGPGETIEVVVDNEIAVQNLRKMADHKGLEFRSEKTGEREFTAWVRAAEGGTAAAALAGQGAGEPGAAAGQGAGELGAAEGQGAGKMCIRDSPNTIRILEENGFLYDSSLMGNDLHPYYPRPVTPHSDRANEFGEPSKILELPVSWFPVSYTHLV